MFDIFYSGKKPGLFTHESEAHSIEHAQQLSRTRFFWWVSYLCDYTDWDWLWEPVPWQSHQRHAWASQWQKDSETYLVPKNPYQDTNYHPEVIARKCSLADHTYVIDHFDNNLSCVQSQITSTQVTAVRYFDNYLDTLKRIARQAHAANHQFIWICSSVCDYQEFDWTWHPEIWQKHLLHVFPSNTEKFGDTFLMHVPQFVSNIDQFDLLECYPLNFVSTISVPRRNMPCITHSQDTHVSAIKNTTWTGPLAVFSITSPPDDLPCVPLWRSQTKTVVPLDKGSCSVIVPHCAVPCIKTQVYDYPYINKSHATYAEHPLDIIFVSNNEPNAEENWQHLRSCVPQCHNLHRIDQVQGRIQSEQAAAAKSDSTWYFRVPAKLKVNKDFDWSWQPDRLQQPKNYIFHAYNPVINLQYGHMAIVALNKSLCLATQGQQLDFVMESAHEVVPILSGTANYVESPWMAWRTAFREVLKLKHSLPNVENQYRLDLWLNSDSTVKYAQWSLWGAEDAMDYYTQVGGEFQKIKQSYEWAWLSQYASIKRNLEADQ